MPAARIAAKLSLKAVICDRPRTVGSHRSRRRLYL